MSTFIKTEAGLRSVSDIASRVAIELDNHRIGRNNDFSNLNLILTWLMSIHGRFEEDNVQSLRIFLEIHRAKQRLHSLKELEEELGKLIGDLKQLQVLLESGTISKGEIVEWRDLMISLSNT